MNDFMLRQLAEEIVNDLFSCGDEIADRVEMFDAENKSMACGWGRQPAIEQVLRRLNVSFSKLKPADKFATKWQSHGFAGSDITSEYQFDESRKWRFDFAWPSLKVAVEIDGFGFGHQAQQHIAKQNEKQNAAVEQGWLVLRFDSRLLGSHEKVEDAVEQVCRVLSLRYS